MFWAPESDPPSQQQGLFSALQDLAGLYIGIAMDCTMFGTRWCQEGIRGLLHAGSSEAKVEVGRLCCLDEFDFSDEAM